MSERNQIVVVLIVALLLGAFIDRATALKIVAGVALLWTLQNQPTVFDCIRKLFSLRRGGPSVREYRGGIAKLTPLKGSNDPGEVGAFSTVLPHQIDN